MSDKDVILSKINIIKNCLMGIERASKEEKEPLFLMNIYELNLQRAVQASIDLANIVIAKEGLGLPNTYKSSFEILTKHKVISEKLMKVLVKMVGFRNISVHEYGEVEPEIVKNIVKKHLGDFSDFYTIIYERVMRDW